MHSKIIELSKNPVEERVRENQFYDGFSGWIADSVADVDEDVRDSVISYFKEGLSSSYSDLVAIGEETVTFKEGFKDAYAAKMLECLNEAVSKADIKSIRNGMTRYHIEKILGDPFGFYIYEDGCLFIENCWLTQNLEEGAPYYFGGVVDYHY